MITLFIGYGFVLGFLYLAWVAANTSQDAKAGYQGAIMMGEAEAAKLGITHV